MPVVAQTRVIFEPGSTPDQLLPIFVFFVLPVLLIIAFYRTRSAWRRSQLRRRDPSAARSLESRLAQEKADKRAKPLTERFAGVILLAVLALVLLPGILNLSIDFLPINTGDTYGVTVRRMRGGSFNLGLALDTVLTFIAGYIPVIPVLVLLSLVAKWWPTRREPSS